jgi:hypothetical protein
VPSGGEEDTGLDSTSTTAPSTTTTGPSEDDDNDDEAASEPDFPAEPEPCGDVDNPCVVDILVVVDNSRTMADPQLALSRALVQLVGRLERDDEFVKAVDAQLMFTTTDMGNPMCEPFEVPGYDAAMGSPTTTGCNERIGHFVGVGQDPPIRYDACTSVCPLDVEPADVFVAFATEGIDNVPDGDSVDVDGDGVLDSRAAQAVACLSPQGISGCGYEQPLNAMLRALAPDAEWNTGERPFLRPDSTLIVVIATDETDCSMDDFELMSNTDYQLLDPDTGERAPSSAICWQAGVQCEGPDMDGVHVDCVPYEGPLTSTTAYTDRLIGDLRELEGRDVLMLAVTGVPPVTEHNPVPPYEPVDGGIADLVVREYRGGAWPDGDLLPSDIASGVTIEHKRFDTRIGPGCADVDVRTGREVQAIPNPRVDALCRSLDLDDPNAVPRCCIESVCDPQPSFDCIGGWLYDPFDPLGG